MYHKILLATAAAGHAAAFWQPTVGTSWYIQLSGDFDANTNLNRTAYDLDLLDHLDSSYWETLKDNDRKSICYFSAGSYEDWRLDKANFTKADYGNGLEGWEGEYWLDTRRESVRENMKWRLDKAQEIGCDAVDPDNVDAFDNNNGLGLTEQDAIDFVNFLASEAHDRGMAMGLKNAASIIDGVLENVEFQVNEQCGENNECTDFQKFIEAGKPVFRIEYPDDFSDETVKGICGDKTAAGFSTTIKNMDLDTFTIDCPLP